MFEIKVTVDAPSVELLASALKDLAAAAMAMVADGRAPEARPAIQAQPAAQATQAQAAPEARPAIQAPQPQPAQPAPQAATPLDKAMGLAESEGANIGRQAADAACRRLVGETYLAEVAARPDWKEKFDKLSAHLLRLASTISGGRTHRPAQLTEAEARRFAEEAALLEWGEDGNVRTKMPF